MRIHELPALHLIEYRLLGPTTTANGDILSAKIRLTNKSNGQKIYLTHNPQLSVDAEIECYFRLIKVEIVARVHNAPIILIPHNSRLIKESRLCLKSVNTTNTSEQSPSVVENPVPPAKRNSPKGNISGPGVNITLRNGVQSNTFVATASRKSKST